MRESPLMRLVVLFGFSLAVFCNGSEESKAQRRSSNTSDAIYRDAVWQPPQKALDVLSESRPAGVQCLTSIMRQFSASPKAVEFSTLVEGYMTSFREMGRIDLVVVECPFRANTNRVYFLANGKPQVLETNLTGEYQGHTDGVDERKRIDIKTDPIYRSIVKRFPKVELELARNTFEAMRPLPEGGQEFVFNYALVNNCRACDVVGRARVAFDFDAAGSFMGTRLLRLSSDPK